MYSVISSQMKKRATPSQTNETPDNHSLSHCGTVDSSYGQYTAPDGTETQHNISDDGYANVPLGHTFPCMDRYSRTHGCSERCNVSRPHNTRISKLEQQ